MISKKRQKEIEESINVLEEEINDLESRKKKLTDREKAIIKKMIDISKILGYRLEEDVPVSLLYKKRELEKKKGLGG